MRLLRNLHYKLEALRKNFYVFMATASGTVKRVELEQFSNVRSNGLRAIELNEEDTSNSVLQLPMANSKSCCSRMKVKRFVLLKLMYVQWAVHAKGVRGMRVNFGSAQAEGCRRRSRWR